MTYSSLAYLWGREDCEMWAVITDLGHDVTEHSLFVEDSWPINRAWLFLEFRHGHKYSWLPQETYMKVYRIDGLFLWEYR
jgi:hypothetical protein